MKFPREHIQPRSRAAVVFARCNGVGTWRPVIARTSRALTLLEMMVAVTLLAVIMVGLLAMFQYTQRALHVAHTQTDVFENARGAIQLIARDLSEVSDYGDSNVFNIAVARYDNPIGTIQPDPIRPGTRMFFDEAFWLTHVNDAWQGIGYYVDGTNTGVGTLYRFTETTNIWAAPSLKNRFAISTNTHRVSDGIVHFWMESVFIYRSPSSAPGKEQYIRQSDFTFPTNTFTSLSNVFVGPTALPVFIDLEIGVLEPATLKQFNALTNNPAVAQNFLRQHSERIHFFRERVPIHNFINPYRENEVQ
jgi:type II secretory pathway pseudopilin PulG